MPIRLVLTTPEQVVATGWLTACKKDMATRARALLKDCKYSLTYNSIVAMFILLVVAYPVATS